LNTVKRLIPQKVLVVVGHQRELIMDYYKDWPLQFVIQAEQLGTGHAVLCAKDLLSKDCDIALIVCGDVPLIRTVTLDAMIKDHLDKQPPLTIMTTTLADPTNYGRIISDGCGRVLRIVEEQDADEEEKTVQEINAGIYCADINFLFPALASVGRSNSQGEIYLTDIVKIANDNGIAVNRFSGASAEEVLGVNSVVELAAAQRYLEKRSS